MRAESRVQRALQNLWPLIALLLIVAVASRIASLGGEVLHRQVTEGLIDMIMVVGFYMFAGTSGVFSFGHISFMAIGAYTTGLLVLPPDNKEAVMSQLPPFILHAHWSSTAAIVLGGAFAAVFAFVLSIPLMRLSGIAASLATFAVLNIVYVVCSNWTGVTNGTGGIAGVPTVTGLNETLVWALVAIVAAFVFQNSRYGLRLRSSREDEAAARSVGIGVLGERRIAFVVSAFFTGVAGGLYAEFIGSFNADSFYLAITFLIVVMLVVGGITSLAGAIVGTIFISFVSQLLLQLEDGFNIAGAHVPGRPGIREVVLAIIMLSVLLLRPRGLTGGYEISWPFTPGRPIGRRRQIQADAEKARAVAAQEKSVEPSTTT